MKTIWASKASPTLTSTQKPCPPLFSPLLFLLNPFFIYSPHYLSCCTFNLQDQSLVRLCVRVQSETKKEREIKGGKDTEEKNKNGKKVKIRCSTKLLFPLFPFHFLFSSCFFALPSTFNCSTIFLHDKLKAKNSKYE